MMYSHSDWNHKQGTIPVHWKSSDYEDLKQFLEDNSDNIQKQIPSMTT